MVGLPEDSPRWKLSMLAEELAEPLRLLRVSMKAREAVIIYAPSGGPLRVIASEPLGGSVFTPEEPVRSNIQWSPVAATARHVRLTSLMRPVSLDFDRALILPFADGHGHGEVILGSAAALDAETLATVRRFARDIDALRARVHETRHRDLDRAYRVVARAATSDVSLDRVFDITLAAARNLLEGDVAYLSLPVDDNYFVFTRTLGINTDPFRDLRVGSGEGLGGAARETGHPIRSLNYEEDRNLRAAMREETRGEGINSALAVPVRDGGTVEAVLYVASRRPRAYSEDDERVLADFANAALLGLDRSNLDESRREVVRDQERARLAQSLHDDLVRRLTQIGFAAEELEHQSTGDSRSRAASISASVDECMSLVRDELRHLLQSDRASECTLGDVAERVFAVPSVSGMSRTADFSSGGVSGAGMHVRVPADIGEAMCRVGQEAVFNAENHSKGDRCSMSFEVHPGVCVMSVSDDGRSFDAHEPFEGHYGIEFMKREARKVGGEVRFDRTPSGGLSVTASFPIGSDQAVSS
ncbi:GAF domain-containing protein [Rhodococcus koreensis]